MKVLRLKLVIWQIIDKTKLNSWKGPSNFIEKIRKQK